MNETHMHCKWDFGKTSGQHTNGPSFCSLTAASLKTGIVIHITNSKYQSRMKELARVLLELADCEYESKL